MKDPVNPTEAEILTWAYAPDAVEPMQDWDLVVADLRYAALLLRLAEDAACPKQEWFAGALRTLVDDCVRTRGQAHDVEQVRALLERAAESSDAGLADWARAQRVRIRSI